MAWDGEPLTADEREAREAAFWAKWGIVDGEVPGSSAEELDRFGREAGLHFACSRGGSPEPCWCGSAHAMEELAGVRPRELAEWQVPGLLCPMCGDAPVRLEVRTGKGRRRSDVCVACGNRLRKRGEHGSARCYRSGCRCDVCVAEQADRETR